MQSYIVEKIVAKIIGDIMLERGIMLALIDLRVRGVVGVLRWNPGVLIYRYGKTQETTINNHTCIANAMLKHMMS